MYYRTDQLIYALQTCKLATISLYWNNNTIHNIIIIIISLDNNTKYDIDTSTLHIYTYTIEYKKHAIKHNINSIVLFLYTIIPSGNNQKSPKK